MARGVLTVIISVAHYVRLALSGSLCLDRDRLGSSYAIENRNYAIFRETERPKARGETVILVIGFRLKLIGSNPALHRLFQRVCIFTTPFWSGLKGFKTKLWMVDPLTKNYLGIYDWRGKREAQSYLDFLLPILDFFSVNGSVWAKQVHGQGFEDYLGAHEIGVELDS